MNKAIAIFSICVAILFAALVAPVVRDAATVRAISTSPEALYAVKHASEHSPAFTQAFLDWVKKYIMDMLGGFTETKVLAVEKMIAGRTELQKANLNIKAANDSSERFADAKDKFNSAPERTCYVLNEAMETRIAIILHQVNQKAVSRQMTKRLSQGDNSEFLLKEKLDSRYKKYCSEEDVERSKCNVPTIFQNADIIATTLFVPNTVETLTKEQAQAAVDYASMATFPVTPEDLPENLESTAAGQRLLLERKHAIAIESMVAGTFARVVAARMPRN